jgi:hypothetical protein
VVAQTGQTGQRFYDASNETLSVVAVCINNADCLPLLIVQHRLLREFAQFELSARVREQSANK